MGNKRQFVRQSNCCYQQVIGAYRRTRLLKLCPNPAVCFNASAALSSKGSETKRSVNFLCLDKFFSG
jgi:hypothetical protein